MEYFSKKYRVVALDLAGHGESGIERLNYTMPAFGKDVVSVVEKLQLTDSVLIGHSMGGDAIIEAAQRVPSLIRGLVWVDAYFTLSNARSEKEKHDFTAPFRESFVDATRKFVRTMFIPSSDEALVDWVVSDMSAAPPEVAIDSMLHATTFEDEIIAGLKVLKVPVVAINTEFRPTDSEALRLHGVKTVLMSGVGHFPMMEDASRFNRELEKIILEERKIEKV